MSVCRHAAERWSMGWRRDSAMVSRAQELWLSGASGGSAVFWSKLANKRRRFRLSSSGG